MLLCLIFEAKSLYVVFMISDEKVFLAQNFYDILLLFSYEGEQVMVSLNAG